MSSFREFRNRAGPAPIITGTTEHLSDASSIFTPERRVRNDEDDFYVETQVEEEGTNAILRQIADRGLSGVVIIRNEKSKTNRSLEPSMIKADIEGLFKAENKGFIPVRFKILFWDFVNDSLTADGPMNPIDVYTGDRDMAIVMMNDDADHVARKRDLNFQARHGQRGFVEFDQMGYSNRIFWDDENRTTKKSIGFESHFIPAVRKYFNKKEIVAPGGVLSNTPGSDRVQASPTFDLPSATPSPKIERHTPVDIKWSQYFVDICGITEYHDGRYKIECDGNVETFGEMELFEFIDLFHSKDEIQNEINMVLGEIREIAEYLGLVNANPSYDDAKNFQMKIDEIFGLMKSPHERQQLLSKNKGLEIKVGKSTREDAQRYRKFIENNTRLYQESDPKNRQKYETFSSKLSTLYKFFKLRDGYEAMLHFPDYLMVRNNIIEALKFATPSNAFECVFDIGIGNYSGGEYIEKKLKALFPTENLLYFLDPKNREAERRHVRCSPSRQ